MKKWIVSVVVCAVALCSHAADRGTFVSSWFHYVPYGQSLYADEHPDFFRCDISPTTLAPSYTYSGDPTGWKVQIYGLFGANISIWDGSFAGGKYGLSVSQTASANLWMDLLEPTTSPVVNTDYRIAAPTVTFVHRFAAGMDPQLAVRGAGWSWREPFLKNYSISIAPFKHESTHIGDEMVLQRADMGYSLRRVNVSYNYMQCVLTLNEPENRYALTHTFRVGLMVLLNPREGWYFVESRDGDVDRLPSDKPSEPSVSPYSKRYGPSDMPIEAYVQYQFQTPCSQHGWQGVVSAELRNRAMYAYSLSDKQGSGVGSEPLAVKGDYRRWTYNLFVGARYNMPHYDGYFSRFAFGLRAYYGNCPYGMFRSENNFSHVGLCLIYQ